MNSLDDKARIALIEEEAAEARCIFARGGCTATEAYREAETTVDDAEFAAREIWAEESRRANEDAVLRIDPNG